MATERVPEPLIKQGGGVGEHLSAAITSVSLILHAHYFTCGV